MTENNISVKGFNRFINEKMGISIMNDPHQQLYVEAMLENPHTTPAVFLDAEAGTGKTSLAISLAYYLLNREKIDQIIYVRAPVSVNDIGHLPGDLGEKEAPYMVPGLEALGKLSKEDENLAETLIRNNKLKLVSSAFLRGVDWGGNKITIVDEAQNFNLTDLQTVLTRPHDSVRKIIIGSTNQVDKGVQLYTKKRITAFELFARHFDEWTDLNVKRLTLKTNYRGKFSLLADKISHSIEYIDNNEDGSYPKFELGYTNEEIQEAWNLVNGVSNDTDDGEEVKVEVGTRR